jgi:hypothetical protein
MSSPTLYDWIPFFDALGRSVYDLSQDVATRESRLMEKVNLIFEPGHRIRSHSTIDPFSFIYALAQRNTKYQRTDVFTKAKEAFAITEAIPTDWNFPTPTPNTKAMFYAEGSYIDADGNVLGNLSLWKLFQQVHTNNQISDHDVRNALALKNVGFTKLSQVLFLVNPRAYMPFDTQMDSLPIRNLQGLKKYVQQIDEKGISVYFDIIEELKRNFPGCELFEINLFNVLINSDESDRLELSNKYCQVSSYVAGQKEEDHFPEFVKLNAVWTGDAASTSGAVTYRVEDFSRGDLVLVRRGTRNLGGIGVIVNNQYAGTGFHVDKAIEIIWLAKEDKYTGNDALGQWIGFSHATEKTQNKFRDLYPVTFQVIDDIRAKQNDMNNLSIERFKNIILYGPPGTGKTRLAEQIAEWLTSDNRQDSVIEAIEKKIFKGDPNIAGNERIKLIQFHPSYTYEDFVRGIRADTEGDKLKYVVENRTLIQFALKASQPENQQKPFVLIIDEINRANLNNVLGELIYALEYRGKIVESMYELGGDREISLPNNLFIIGTMNSADRSVSHLDYAIRRRFNFVPVPPDNAAITGTKAKDLFRSVQAIFDLHTSPEFNRDDVRIGHSYFLGPETELTRRLAYEIKPILREYVKDGILLQAASKLIDDLKA